LLGFCLGSALFQTRGTRTAVVIAREAVVRRGPLDESQIAFTVRDGAELRILDQKDDWLQVSTDLRRTGWLRRDQVLLSRI
ncbi:MAG TPA: SH3 domain-containing protein, partial [Bacillota bacterium]|nr:SH3 domain-containing protein [Bacillota bacterium]